MRGWRAVARGACLSAGLAVLVCLHGLAAADSIWQHDPATAGDWFDAANWPGGVPSKSGYKSGQINNGGTARIDAGAASTYYLYLGYDSGQFGAVTLNGGTLADMVWSAAAVPTHGSSTTPTWTGKGITSSNVKTEYFIDGPGARVLGVFDNNFNGNGTPYFADGTLDGVSLGPDAATQANHVIVKYLYMGDLNGDGLVNGADYNVIDNAFVRQSRGDSFVIDWQTGDLNGDGILNGVDYNFIDNAEVKWVAAGWNVTGPPSASPPPEAAPPPSEGAMDSAVGAAAVPTGVPEPGTLGLLTLGAAALGRRRMRHAA